MRDGPGMSTIVSAVTRWLLAVVLVFGLAVALYGHVSPGGGFAGGVVVACGFVLATLAFGGRAEPALSFGRLASALDAAGALLFLGVAAVGFAAGVFFERWLALGEPFTLGSATFVVLMNVAILLKVGAGVFAGFLALVLFARRAPREGTGP